MKRKISLLKNKIALYNPYLNTLGGGERHILSILQALEEVGADITIFWDKDLKKDIKKNLGLQFRRLNFAPNVFKKSTFDRTKALSQFSTLIYVTDGSYFFSPCEKNYIFCMVPNPALYKMSLMNKLKTKNYSFITNSFYTQKWLEKWGIQSQVIYPYIDDDFMKIDVASLKKESIILSVGRFFPHLHSKRQDILIETFLKAKATHPLFADFKLILAGGLMDSDKEYFNSLKKLAGDDKSIVFYPNIDYSRLLTLYKKSSIFWHGAGYEIDENQHPEQVEHLGITPLEAMSAGCITFCYQAGGPKEIISDGMNGFLFDTRDGLIAKTVTILKNTGFQKMIQLTAKDFVETNFSFDAFKEQVYKVFQI